MTAGDAQDLHDQAQGADRPPVFGARQAVLERAVHDAEARRRDRSQHADLRLHRLRPVRLQDATSGSRATRRSTSSSTSTSRAPSRPRGLPAARSPRSTASSGARSPTTSRRSTRCSPARSTTSRRRRTTCCRCSRPTPNVKLVDWNPLGNQYTFRPNHLHKPFDNPKVRQALWYAFNQEDFLEAVIGDPDYYKVCKAMFVCGTAARVRQGHGRAARVELRRRRRSC